MRVLRSFLALCAALSVTTVYGCAAISGISDFTEDECAFGCDGGADGQPPGDDASDGTVLPDGPQPGEAGIDASFDGGVDAADDSTTTSDAAPDAAPDVVADVAPDVANDSSGTCGNLGQSCCPGSTCNSPFACQANQTCGCGSLSFCNGACVNETNDPNNCNACGHVCPAGANQTATCSSSACGTKCNTGFADCADAGTSCATNLGSDNSNCGTCGHACTGGQVCTGGSCACSAGTQLCNGACINTQSDSNNCGACGHGCLGGACTAGACQPVTLISGLPAAPKGIAVDAQYVYFAMSAANEVAKVSINGGNRVPLSTAPNANSPYGIAIDSNNVYFTNLNDVSKVPLGGGTTTILANGTSPSPASNPTFANAFYIVTNGANVYFDTSGNGGSVFGISVNGGTMTTYSSTQKFAYGMAIDATSFYWGTFQANDGLWKAPVNGGNNSGTNFAAGATNALMEASDGTFVYFTTYQSAGSVLKVPVNGGTQTPLVPNVKNPFGIVVDATYVYFGSDVGQAVYKVPVGGGPFVQIATDTGGPTHMAQDSKAIYWSSPGNLAIMKLAK